MREGPTEMLMCSCGSVDAPEESNRDSVIMCGDHEEYSMLPHNHANLDVFEKADAAVGFEENVIEPGAPIPACFSLLSHGNRQDLSQCNVIGKSNGTRGTDAGASIGVSTGGASGSGTCVGAGALV